MSFLASEARYEARVERVPVGVRATVAGLLLACNTAAARLFGFANRQAMMAANVWQLYFRREEREELLSVLRQHRHLPAHEVLLRRADRGRVWVPRDRRC